MIVTIVVLVRTTSVTTRPAFTTASHPVASACAESSPSMMFCRWASKAAPAASQVSLLSVMTSVSPPETISASVVEAATVPLTAAIGPVRAATLKVGAATIALPPVSALAGRVAVTVSSAVMS